MKKKSRSSRQRLQNGGHLISVPDWLRVTPASKGEYRQALVAVVSDFKRSGLDAASMDRLQVVPLTAKQALELVDRIKPRDDDFYEGFDYCGWVIPYHGLNGQQIENHACLRLLGAEDDEELEQYDLRKYMQFDPSARSYEDADWSPRFYLPPMVDWVKIADDVSVDIYFTEGEKNR